MINEDKFSEILAGYKAGFSERFRGANGKGGEDFKWIAVHHFQSYWKPERQDFADMLSEALSKTGSILGGNNFFPIRMIIFFAEKNPEKVRGMFENLYDENTDVTDRINAFKKASDELLDEYGDGSMHHFQNGNAISTYLWLKYPDKYYVYKFSIARVVASKLESNYQFKAGDEENFKQFFDLYNEINGYLYNDDELRTIVSKEVARADWYYADPQFKTLTIDFGYYIKQQDDKNKSQRDNTGEAIADEDVRTVRYWLYAPGDGAMYWDEFYNAGIMAIGWDDIGDLSAYDSKDAMKQAMKEQIDPSRSFMNDAHATWQFANEMHDGDIVFVKKGMHQIIGRGVVTSDYVYDSTREYFKNVRNVNWTNKGIWQHPGRAVMKTLTDITQYTDYVKQLNALFDDDPPIDPPEEILKSYNKDMFLDQVFMGEQDYDNLVALLMRKKNVILEGAPGVGKTYTAKRLAYSIMGVKDPNRVSMVQFHQSYSYEDFIMGLRPTEKGGYEIRYGSFYEFCKKAEIDSEDTPYFFIIDEINRGNISKIFGELFMLIEPDKRGIELRLLYGDETFSVPKNVYIIGMMNTADRSLAIMDYALRRRFAFFEMQPGFDSDGFRKYQSSLNSEKFDKLISCVKELNEAISDDESLGKGFQIGHSYFCDLKETSDQTLSGIVEYELIPLLKEYWFDEPSNVRTWEDRLRNAIK